MFTTREPPSFVIEWWLRRWRSTYLRQTKRREHIWHMYFGAPPCRISIWRFSTHSRENVILHALQARCSNWRRYLSGRRWGCSRRRWFIRPKSRVNWHPQPSHVRWYLRSCNCRLWTFSVIALPSTLPHSSQRCSVTPRWTVEMWSFICDSSWNVREQYSHTNDFSAYHIQHAHTHTHTHTHYITMVADKYNTSLCHDRHNFATFSVQSIFHSSHMKELKAPFTKTYMYCNENKRKLSTLLYTRTQCYTYIHCTCGVQKVRNNWCMVHMHHNQFICKKDLLTGLLWRTVDRYAFTGKCI